MYLEMLVLSLDFCTGNFHLLFLVRFTLLVIQTGKEEEKQGNVVTVKLCSDEIPRKTAIDVLSVG
jgi:hypothetical protein